MKGLGERQIAEKQKSRGWGNVQLRDGLENKLGIK
jgi:hypothetical protein